MQKTVVILQPGYLPWLGFFEQLDRADIFVLFDTVQYDKSWRNRNRIKTIDRFDDYNWRWLTVPVKAHGLPLIKGVEIADNGRWAKNHVGAIENNYHQAEFFDDYFPRIKDVILKHRTGRLLDLDIALIELISDWLQIDTEKIVLASDLGIDLPRGKTEKNIAICQHLKANTFYEASAGRAYLDRSQFSKIGIDLVYQDYHHPQYKQLHGEFVPFMSVIDLIFNEGPSSLDIIRQGGNR